MKLKFQKEKTMEETLLICKAIVSAAMCIAIAVGARKEPGCLLGLIFVGMLWS